jgi:integration host factor subunit alpha
MRSTKSGRRDCENHIDLFCIPKKDSVRIVESLLDIIKDDLDKGNDVRISGFGKWTVKAKKKRKGRNPQTGKELMIAARRVVTFKPSNVLRDAVNSGG